MISQSITLASSAKVNLYLHVLGKRPDGFHELLTLFERIDLKDTIEIDRIAGSFIEIFCADPRVPQDRTNLAVKAAEAFCQAAGISDGIRITIDKKIPVSGGLGGGSSNAAVVLQGLQQMYGNPLPEKRLEEIARTLGSDVPFFLHPEPFAVGTGRGDQIQRLDFQPNLWHLLVAPGFPISTKEVYRAFAASRTSGAGPSTGLGAGLTASGADVTLLQAALKSDDFGRIRSLLFNALEPTVEALYPAIMDVKAAIQTDGGIPCPMVSGSGSTVMALCSSQKEAEKAAESIVRREPGWQVFVVKTGSISDG